MYIRKAQLKDLEAIMAIYEYARRFMAEHGNPTQWGTHWPPESVIKRDIASQKCHVCIENEEIEAVFYYDYGEHVEPFYDQIHDGSWLEEGPYGVVHRIASRGRVKGAGAFCLNWAVEQSKHLRIDTHGDNKVLQYILGKLGFTYCGWVNVEEDDMPRLAYEKIL